MNKRVTEIAKERGLPAKEVIEKLKAAGIEVKAASSSVDEAAALRALGNGGGAKRPAPRRPDTPRGDRALAEARNAEQAAKARSSNNRSSSSRSAGPRANAPKASTPPTPPPPAPTPPVRPDAIPVDPRRAAEAAGGGRPEQHKRPTRDSLQGERAPGSAG